MSSPALRLSPKRDHGWQLNPDVSQAVHHKTCRLPQWCSWRRGLYQLPSPVQLLCHKLQYQIDCRHFACQHFHSMLDSFGLRDVESKEYVTKANERAWETLKKLQEE